MSCAKQIVVVEDDEDIRQALAEVLRDEGFGVTCAANGREGLRLVGNERPCLVLVDLMMPVMTGWEFINALKADPALSTIPIIVTSACAASSPAAADRVLPKPLKLDEIITTVHEFCDADSASGERRDAMRELARRNVEMAELRRLREDMLAMVVHDLKSPLTAIVANVEYVLAADAFGHDADGQRAALEDVRTAAARMSRMIANLLDVARFEAGLKTGSARLIALDEFAAEQMRRRRSLAELHGISFTHSLAPMAVRADVDQLTRVSDNILDNAFRYTPRGGRIDLSTMRIGDRAILAIGNSGPAIPERTRATIFEKFAQAEPGWGRMNAGLGLYFCRLAVESVGGLLTVGSSDGLPTVFTIDLPLVERA